MSSHLTRAEGQLVGQLRLLVEKWMGYVDNLDSLIQASIERSDYNMFADDTRTKVAYQVCIDDILVVLGEPKAYGIEDD